MQRTGTEISAADKRITELLDRWLASVELHSSYLELDDAAYAKVQSWPRHQRPTRWIVDLARARLNELRRELVDRRAKGDLGYAESLELMAFLTTLLGSEHVDRFIPQATGVPRESAPPASRSPTEREARPAREPVKTAVDPAAARPVSTADAAVQRPRAAGDSAPLRSRPVKAPAAAARAAKPDKATATVIADAARLLSWGREWPHLAGLIARLADRPPEPEVWAILRTHRATIEARARRIPD
jgi:hypothetical protein